MNMAEGAGPDSQGILKWSYFLGSATHGAITIGADGTLYVISDYGQLQGLTAFDPNTQKIKWQWTDNMPMQGEVAIGADGTVYLSADRLYAFDPSTGTVKWACSIGSTDQPVNSADSSPAIGSDGTLYVESFDSNLYAIDSASGTVKWTFPTTDGGICSPAIGPDGTVYFTSYDGILAIDPTSGTQIWSYAATFGRGGGWVFQSPTMGNNGMVYAGTSNGLLYAWDAKTGAVGWTCTTNSSGNPASTPAIGPDGTVYETTVDFVPGGTSLGTFLAVDGGTGTIKWTASQGEYNDPVIGGGGTIFIANSQDVFAYNSGGSIIWTYPVTDASDFSIGADGTLYFASWSQGDQATFCALGSPELTAVSAPPAIPSGAAGVNAKVQLDAASPSGASTVKLTSSSVAARVPSSLSLAAGVTSGSFNVESMPGASGQVTITATLNGSSKQSVINLVPGAQLFLAPSSIIGGHGTSGMIDLNGPAGTGGLTFTLGSNNSKVGLPATVTVLAGASSASFKISTPSVASTTSVTISAVNGSATSRATLDLYSDWNFYAGAPTLVGGVSTSGVIQTNSAVSVSETFSLHSSSADVQVPSVATIASGKAGASFAITTSGVSSNETVTLTATEGASSKTTSIQLTPASISNFYASPNTVTGGTTTHGVVQIPYKAGPQGELVHLWSSDYSLATLPIEVTIPAGKTGVSFVITSYKVSSATTVHFGAFTASSSMQTVLNLSS